jgi:hypothetical protein
MCTAHTQIVQKWENRSFATVLVSTYIFTQCHWMVSNVTRFHSEQMNLFEEPIASNVTSSITRAHSNLTKHSISFFVLQSSDIDEPDLTQSEPFQADAFFHWASRIIYSCFRIASTYHGSLEV